MQNPLVRRIVGVIAGMIVGSLLVFLVEGVGHSLYPPPAGTDLGNPEHVKKLMDVIPTGALAFVLVGWALGSFGAAYVAATISRTVGTAWIVAGLFIALTAINFAMIPHPLWMMVTGVLIPLATAWLVVRMRGSAEAG